MWRRVGTNRPRKKITSERAKSRGVNDDVRLRPSPGESHMEGGLYETSLPRGKQTDVGNIEKKRKESMIPCRREQVSGLTSEW